MKHIVNIANQSDIKYKYKGGVLNSKSLLKYSKSIDIEFNLYFD